MELIQHLCILTAIYLQFNLFAVCVQPELKNPSLLLYLVFVSSGVFMWYNPIAMILCTTTFVSLGTLMYSHNKQLLIENKKKQSIKNEQDNEEIRKQVNDFMSGFETEFAEKESKSTSTNTI